MKKTIGINLIKLNITLILIYDYAANYLYVIKLIINF